HHRKTLYFRSSATYDPTSPSLLVFTIEFRQARTYPWPTTLSPSLSNKLRPMTSCARRSVSSHLMTSCGPQGYASQEPRRISQNFGQVSFIWDSKSCRRSGTALHGSRVICALSRS